jgi:hypothetical protein
MNKEYLLGDERTWPELLARVLFIEELEIDSVPLPPAVRDDTHAILEELKSRPYLDVLVESFRALAAVTPSQEVAV